MPVKRRLLAVVLFSACPLVLGQNPTTSGGLSSPVSTTPTLSQDEIHALINRAAEQDLRNDQLQRDYTYVERSEQRRLGGDGKVKSTESKTYDVMELYGEQVERLIAKDDKPLSPKDAAKEDKRIQKLIDKRKNESAEQRKKRLEKEEKDREQAREFVKEINDAYNFRFVGMENVEGREAYVIDAEPRPGFQPHRKEAKILPKFKFRAWIDQADSEWVKLDAQCIDTVSFGWFIARIHKGSNVQIEQTRVNDEVWLPEHIALMLDARVLFKGLNLEQDIRYSNYKKFRADTRIMPAEEAPK
jgi:hypothetical protein